MIADPPGWKQPGHRDDTGATCPVRRVRLRAEANIGGFALPLSRHAGPNGQARSERKLDILFGSGCAFHEVEGTTLSIKHHKHSIYIYIWILYGVAPDFDTWIFRSDVVILGVPRPWQAVDGGVSKTHVISS